MGRDKNRPTCMRGEPQAHTSGNVPSPSGEPQARKDWDGGVECGEPLAHGPGIHGEPLARDADEAVSSETTVHRDTWPSLDGDRAFARSHTDESDGHGEPSAHALYDEAQRTCIGLTESRFPEQEDAKNPTIYDGSGEQDAREESHASTSRNDTPTASPNPQRTHNWSAVDKGKARANPLPEPVTTTSTYGTPEAGQPPMTVHSHTAMLSALMETVAVIHCQMTDLSVRLAILERRT